MTRFEYQGVNEMGQTVSGPVEAVDRKAAIVSLKAKGHFVTSLTEATQSGEAKLPAKKSLTTIKTGIIGERKVSGKDILALTGQLHTALQAGLPLLGCLEVIQQQMTKPAIKHLLSNLTEAVSAGQSLSEAMAKHGKSFGPLYLAMIRVGETGGILEQTTEQLTRLLKREDQVKTNLKNASVYPLFVLGTGVVSVIILVTFVLPRIVGAITENAAAIPWPTRILMGLSDFCISYGYVLVLALIVIGVAAYKWLQSPAGKIRWHRFKMKVPVLGNVQRTIAVGRFARTLGALTKGGITILEALTVVRDTLGNEFLARQIDSVTQKVKAGEPLAVPLARSGNFPPLLIQIISVGEQTGKLDEMLLNAAVTFDDQADAAISRFTAVLPAVLVLILALVVGFIIAAILLPIMAMELGVGV